jgi:prolyl-tRNA synthetase
MIPIIFKDSDVQAILSKINEIN